MRISTAKALLGIACFLGVFQGLLCLVGGLVLTFDRDSSVNYVINNDSSIKIT